MIETLRPCLLLPAWIALLAIGACAAPAEPGPAAAVDAQGTGRAIDYTCDGGAAFSVFFREDDSGAVLEDSEIMLRDGQTGERYRLRRERSASGEKYGDAAGVQFFAKGKQAMLLKQGERLYSNCSVTP